MVPILMMSKLGAGVGCSCSKLNNLGLALGIASKFYISVQCDKSAKTKTHKVLGGNF